MNQVAGAGSGSAESSKARKTPPLLFPRATEFQAELRRRVDAYFQTTGKRSRDLPTMYLKTAFILAWFGVSYGLLVFHHNSWLESVLLATSLGLAMAGIGFNVAHDACHGAFSKVPFINELFSVTLDMLGGSSYVWKWKHNFFHHTYTNVVGADDDIDFGFVARLAPEVPLRGLQKYQHLYLWLLYGSLTFSWQYYDFSRLISGSVGPQRIPHPKGQALAIVIFGKVLYVSLMFFIPLMVLSTGRVLVNFVVASFVMSWTLALVFQLAHCVEEAKFPKPVAGSGRLEHEFAVHQIETTADFARKNPLVTWYLGGLNYQVEHHLFPKICHLHYPALSPIVEKTCAQFGIRYTAHRRLRDAIVSHYHFLRRSHTHEAMAA